MAIVTLHTPAPDFTLEDYRGNRVSLSDFRGQYVFLVMNRGFI